MIPSPTLFRPLCVAILLFTAATKITLEGLTGCRGPEQAPRWSFPGDNTLLCDPVYHN